MGFIEPMLDFLLSMVMKSSTGGSMSTVLV